MKIEKTMLIGELIHMDELIPQMLMGAGMHCLGAQLLRLNLWKRHAWFMESTAMIWFPR